MKILIACEFSGVVREAFKEKGHYVISCDLLPTEIESNHHQGNVLEILDNGWDLMIAHPPCQYLSFAGNRFWNLPGREEERQKAFELVKLLYDCSIPKICIENPVGLLNREFRKPDQIIHPYYFGEPELKRTCLWMKRLPKLAYTNKLEKPLPITIGKNTGKKNYKTAMLNTWKDRSRTYQGIAKAMADQWG